MGRNRSDILQKAREYAFLLLKFRPRSEKELYLRMKQKGFADKVIKSTLSYLKKKDFINDSAFARAWVESRLKKPLGLRKIGEELRLKGIDKNIIESALNEIKQDYSEEETVSKIVKAKLSRPDILEPQKAKRRLFSYLLRRGFSPEIASDCLNML